MQLMGRFKTRIHQDVFTVQSQGEGQLGTHQRIPEMAVSTLHVGIFRLFVFEQLIATMRAMQATTENEPGQSRDSQARQDEKARRPVA